MGGYTRCSACMAVYPAGHWAASRKKCPACGGSMTQVADEGPATLDYEHYDSSADIQFDLEGLLSPSQRREAWVLTWLGFGLLALAFGARLGFVFLGGLDGFWAVPIWFDAIVVVMIVLAVTLVVWSARKLVRHRQAVRRAG